MKTVEKGAAEEEEFWSGSSNHSQLTTKTKGDKRGRKIKGATAVLMKRKSSRKRSERLRKLKGTRGKVVIAVQMKRKKRKKRKKRRKRGQREVLVRSDEGPIAPAAVAAAHLTTTATKRRRIPSSLSLHHAKSTSQSHRNLVHVFFFKEPGYTDNTLTRDTTLKFLCLKCLTFHGFFGGSVY